MSRSESMNFGFLIFLIVCVCILVGCDGDNPTESTTEETPLAGCYDRLAQPFIYDENVIYTRVTWNFELDGSYVLRQTLVDVVVIPGAAPVLVPADSLLGFAQGIFWMEGGEHSSVAIMQQNYFKSWIHDTGEYGEILGPQAPFDLLILRGQEGDPILIDTTVYRKCGS